MLAKFSIWFIPIAVLSLTSVESVSADFFDDLVEEGKKKLKEETDKVLKPGQGQPTSPRSPQPSQGASRPQPPSTMPMSAEPDTNTEIGPPVLRKIQGHVVYDISLGYMQERDANFNRMKKWFDYLDLGLTPDLFDKNPECFLSNHVPMPEWDQYLDDKKIHLFKANKKIGTPGYGISQTDWKGNNEFEKARSKKAFIETYRDKFRSAALHMPIQLVFVYPAQLKYDFESQGFPLSGSLNPAGELQSMCGGSFQASVTPYVVRDKEFLQQAQGRNKGMKLWAINPDEAEKLLSRLERVHAGGTDTMAQAYWGIVAEYMVIPGTAVKQNMRKHGESNVSAVRPMIRATVESVGLYEDPDLERPIRKLTITQPVESVMLTGVPEAVPEVDRVMPIEPVIPMDAPETVPKFDRVLLDQETVSLLLLKDHGDILATAEWEVFVQKQIEHDRNYYAYGKPDPTEMEKRDRSLKSGEEPDPTYVPFTPPQFSGAFDTQQMARFKDWTLKRAASLSGTFILNGGFGIYGNGIDRSLRADFTRPVKRTNWDRELLASITQLGYAREQILTVNERLRPYAIVFPSPIKALSPKLSQSEEENFNRASAGMYSEVEIDLTVKKTQLMNAGTREKAVVLFGTPSRYRIIINGNNERVVWKESAYQSR